MIERKNGKIVHFNNSKDGCIVKCWKCGETFNTSYVYSYLHYLYKPIINVEQYNGNDTIPIEGVYTCRDCGAQNILSYSDICTFENRNNRLEYSEGRTTKLELNLREIKHDKEGRVYTVMADWYYDLPADIREAVIGEVIKHRLHGDRCMGYVSICVNSKDYELWF